MANKPSRPTSQPTTSTADAPAGGGTGAKPKLLWLWVGIAAVVLLAGGFAILSSGDDEELTVGSTVPAATDAPASGREQPPGWLNASA